MEDAVSKSNSISDVLRALGLLPKGANYPHIRFHINRLGLEAPKAAPHASGIPTAQPLEAVLVRNSTYLNTSSLKKRLWREGLLKRECYRCGLREWLGKPAPLELEHVNGIRSDNRIENLTILCPNCHAFTSTYRGRNRRTTKISKACCECGGPTSGERCLSCRNRNREVADWPADDILVGMVKNSSYESAGKTLGVTGAAVKKRLQKRGLEGISPRSRKG